MPTTAPPDFSPEVGSRFPLRVRAARPPEAIAGRFLTFELAGQRYGFEMLEVRDLAELADVAPLRYAPAPIRGVLDLAGEVVPVLDLRLRFGLDPAEQTGESAVVVLEYQCGPRRLTTGVLVDRVVETVALGAEVIFPVPEMGGAHDEADFLLGVARQPEGVVFLLDAARVLSSAPTRVLAGFSGR
jgi:purine-binding chemotaxis protein CheW